MDGTDFERLLIVDEEEVFFMAGEDDPGPAVNDDADNANGSFDFAL